MGAFASQRMHSPLRGRRPHATTPTYAAPYATTPTYAAPCFPLENHCEHRPENVSH